MESNKTNGGEPPSIRLRFKYQVNILLDWVCPFTTNWANKCPMAWTSHSDWCQTLSVKNVPVELQRYQWLLYLNGLLSSWITYLSYFNGWEILVGISVRTYQNTSFSINFANKACFTVVCEWNCAFIYLVCFFFFFFYRKWPFFRWSAIMSSWRCAFLYPFISLQSPFYVTLPVPSQLSTSIRFSNLLSSIFFLSFDRLSLHLYEKKSRVVWFIQIVPPNVSFAFRFPLFFQYLKRNYMAVCQALEPVVSVKLKVCVEITGYISERQKLPSCTSDTGMNLVPTLHHCKK